jgi:hypothetical protein
LVEGCFAAGGRGDGDLDAVVDEVIVGVGELRLAVVSLCLVSEWVSEWLTRYQPVGCPLFILDWLVRTTRTLGAIVSELGICKCVLR